jgi:putative effector of murein hydrolase
MMPTEPRVCPRHTALRETPPPPEIPMALASGRAVLTVWTSAMVMGGRRFHSLIISSVTPPIAMGVRRTWKELAPTMAPAMVFST